MLSFHVYICDLQVLRSSLGPGPPKITGSQNDKQPSSVIVDSPLLPDMIFLCYRIWFPSVTGYDIQLTAQVFWRLLCSSGILEFVRGPLLLVSVHSYWSCLVWSSGVVWFIDFLRLKIWRTFLSFWIGISSQSKVFLFYQTVLYWFFSLFMKSYL